MEEENVDFGSASFDSLSGLRSIVFYVRTILEQMLNGEKFSDEERKTNSIYLADRGDYFYRVIVSPNNEDFPRDGDLDGLSQSLTDMARNHALRYCMKIFPSNFKLENMLKILAEHQNVIKELANQESSIETLKNKRDDILAIIEFLGCFER